MSPDTDITTLQQGGPTHHVPKEQSAITGERQLTSPLEAILERHPKRAKDSDGKYEEPKTTVRRSRRQWEKRRMYRPTRQTTHDLQTWVGSLDEVQMQKSPTTPPRQATYGDLVRRDTIALRTEPGGSEATNSSLPREKHQKKRGGGGGGFLAG
jgi:hypothetical protein